VETTDFTGFRGQTPVSANAMKLSRPHSAIMPRFSPNIAAIMSSNPPPASPAVPPVWQTHLNIEEGAQAQYHFLNPALADLFDMPPKLMLDVGCATGMFGAFVKEKHPGAKVIGVELNRAAAEAARQKLDHVFERRLEEVDLGEAGVAPGSIDTVIVADVLEHMYDPWHFMTDLKKHITPDAQIIASIPNTRHLGLLVDFADKGLWPYSDKGLLDITHIRFFTLREIHRFFAETGYKVERVAHNLDDNLKPLYQANKDKPSINLRFGRLSFEQLNSLELAELCTWQFFVRARPA